MKNLSLLDFIFFLVESEGSPKHVAGLLRCRKPDGCSASYAKDLAEELKTHDRLVEPFDLVINFIGLKGPHWERCRDFSIDRHIHRKVLNRERSAETAVIRVEFIKYIAR